VAAVIVLAVIAGGVYVVVDSGPKYPSHWDARVDPIAKWVEQNRHLSYKHAVEVKFLTAAEYTKAITGDAAADAPDGESSPTPTPTPSTEETENNRKEVGELRALGWLTGDLDLTAAGKKLEDSGSLAFYSPDDKKVYVRGTTMTPGLRVTLAHELTHVLQDQYFDLKRDLPSGPTTVRRALAEGDAERIENMYVKDKLTDAERKAYDLESRKASDDSKAQLKGKVPAILETTFASPYILGPTLIEYLQQDGGDSAIDAAFRDLPSEESLFNPLTYKEPAAKPVDVPAPENESSGTKPFDDGTFAPASWYLLLATRLPATQALQAADGWGGDHYTATDDDSTVCVRADIKMDTPGDLKQMYDALTAGASKSKPGTVTLSKTADVIHFKTCDPGKDAKAVGADVGYDLLAVPVTRTQVFDEVRKANGSDAVATCFSNAIVKRFTPAQLTSETYLGTPAAQQVIATLRLGCQ
jgi:hypothetical protein